jgi:hypothetical protein
MRFFFLQDYQHWLLAVFLGLVLVILVYLAFRSYGYSNERADARARQIFDYPEGLKGHNFPTPPFILFLYIGFVVWAVLYVIFIGVFHGAY